MEIKELKSLLLLSETGSITTTADKLNLSVAAIHNHLKVLEQETGVRLYVKNGRRLELTRPAEILLPKIKFLLSQYDEIVNISADFKQSRSGFLKIGAGPTFSSYVLPQMLQEYSRLCPEVEVFVDSGQTRQLFVALEKGKLDLVILVLSELAITPEYSVRASWDFEIVLVSNDKHQHDVCALSELKDKPFILYKQGTFFESLIESYFNESDFFPRVTMRFDNADAIKAMIKAGFGISMLPSWTINAEIKNRELFILEQENPLTAKLALVTRKSKKLSPIVQTFVDVSQNCKLVS